VVKRAGEEEEEASLAAVEARYITAHIISALAQAQLWKDTPVMFFLGIGANYTHPHTVPPNLRSRSKHRRPHSKHYIIPIQLTPHAIGSYDLVR